MSWSNDKARWTLRLRLDADDPLEGPGQGNAPVSLVTNECSIRLPGAIDEPHPDLLAVAAMLIVRPWVGSRVTFDRPISPPLAQALQHGTGVAAGPVDDSLLAREAGPELGLSYSGGIDSIAASELLPRSAPYLHLQRVKHARIPNRAAHIRSEQLAKLVGAAGERGRRVAIVRSDFEYLCLPWPQCPTWPAIGMAGIVLADHYRLGALAFGSVLEVAYLAKGRRFTGRVSGVPRPPAPAGTRSLASGRGGWGSVLAAVGLTLCRPAAGMAEAGTMNLASRSDLADLAQSCVKGAGGRPCLACTKCVRKELLAAALQRRDIHPAIRARLKPGDRAARDLEGRPPLKLQNSVEYIIARIPDLSGTILDDLAKRFDATVESTSWNERYYPPALDRVPLPWRDQVVAALERRVEWMTDDDIKTVETWDAASRMR